MIISHDRNTLACSLACCFCSFLTLTVLDWLDLASKTHVNAVLWLGKPVWLTRAKWCYVAQGGQHLYACTQTSKVHTKHFSNTFKWTTYFFIKQQHMYWHHNLWLLTDKYLVAEYFWSCVDPRQSKLWDLLLVIISWLFDGGQVQNNKCWHVCWEPLPM